MAHLFGKKSAWVASTVLTGSLALTLTACGGGTTPAGNAEAPAAVTSQLDQELHDSLPAEIKTAGKILVGSPTTNAPYITKPGADVVGLIPDLATEVGAVLGVKLEFVETPFPGLIPALQAERLDVAWTVMNDTLEREKTLDFVDWIRTSSAFLIAKGNPKEIKGTEDLCGLKAGTLRGSAQAGLLEEQNSKCISEGKPSVEIKLYDDLGAGQTQLRAKQLDALFGGSVPLKYLAAKVDNGNTFEVAEKTYGGGAFGIAVPKDQEALSSAIESALKAVEANGSYGRVLETHYASDDALTGDEIQINGVGAGVFK